MAKSEIIDLMKSRFKNLSEDVLTSLVTIGDSKEILPSEVIIQQGEDSSEVYFLISGRLAVLIQSENGENRKVNEIPCGEIFGEMSLFQQSKRTATLVAIRQSLALVIKGPVFAELMEREPALYRYISETLIRRLTTANSPFEQTKACQNICFLPLDDSVKCKEIIAQIKNNVAGSVELSSIGEDDINHKIASKSDVLQYINNAENANDFILFEGSLSLNKATEFFLSQSDKIFLIGDIQRTQSLSETEKSPEFKRLTSSADTYLLLDSRSYSDIEKTRLCTKNRKIKSVLHLNQERDFARIARFIIGRSNKLVLSGGGARGFAHIGVLKALNELKIPVDIIGGTSIGAVLGAVFATGWEYDFILEQGYNAFVKDKPLKDYQFPMVSFLKGNKLDKTLEKYFGDLRIEDLPIPFLAVASNMSKMSTEIITDGTVRDAVRASISLPSILPPVIRNNSLLLDGGIVDNMPFDPVQTIGAGPNIGVDLSEIKERTLSYTKIPSNLELTKAKFMKSKRVKVPNIYQIIMGTMTLASDEKKRQNIPKFDVYIKPNVRKFGFLDLKRYYEIVEEGYRSSLPVLQAWKDKQ